MIEGMNGSGSLLERAESLLQDGRYESAGELLLELAGKDPAERKLLLHRAAVAFWKAGIHDRAAGIFRKAAVEYRKAGDRLGESREMIGIGASYHGLGRLGDAYRTIHQSLELAEEMEDPKAVANATNWLGIICKDQGEYSLAMEHHMRALRLSRELASPVDEASTLNSLGLVCHHMGDHSKALEYFGSALDIQRSQDSSWGLPDTLSNMGMAMKELGEYDEALRLYEEALDLRRKTGGRGRIANILNNIGNLYSKTGDCSRALVLHKQALAIRLELGNDSDTSHSLLNLGETWTAMGRPDRAVLCLESSLRYLSETDIPDMELDAVVSLSRALLATGDARRAYETAMKALDLSRQLYDGQVEKRLSESRAILETEHRAREARTLQSKNEKLQELSDMLASQKGQLQLILDYVPAVILFKDVEGRLVRLNRYTAELLGRAPRELVGASSEKLLGPLGGDPSGAAAALAVGEPVLNIEENLEIDGRELCFRAHRVPFRGPDGSFAGTVLFAVDITEEKAAEARKSELREVVERGRRLESMGYLAGTLAHDFNNLLVSIMGNIELASGKTGDPEVIHNLVTASESTNRAAALCGQLLAFSGGGCFASRLSDMSREAGFYAESLGIDPGGTGSVRTRLEEGLPHVKLDPSQLHLALDGIISLWVRCGTPMDALELRTGIVSIDTDYLQGRLHSSEVPRDGEYIYVETCALGKSLSEADLQHLLDPFTDGEVLSAELGVPAAHGVVRAHGGILTYEPGTDGDCVRLHFPVVGEENIPDIDQEPSKPHGERTGPGRVMVVDDEQGVRETALEMLERSGGYEVITCSSGAEALQVLSESSGEFSCVILDLTMPGLSGHEVIQEISRRFPGIGVVLSSGFSERAVYGLEALSAFRGFLKKPYTSSELISAVRDSLEEP